MAFREFPKYRMFLWPLLLGIAVGTSLSVHAQTPRPYPAARITTKKNHVGPIFTDAVRILETQPIEKAQLIYFDQSAADGIGLKVPPGRVGLPDFERAVTEKLGVEIRQGTPVVFEHPGTKAVDGSPLLFVERDSHGGAGRAGFIEVEPDVWVNIKGVGISGAGNTGRRQAGPPNAKFSSHSDGAATLEEAIKETVMGRVADAELKKGGSRVVAIFYTGRTITYPDGRKVPLATIVRTPLTRFDAAGRPYQALQSLAEANSKRLLKGDFVNHSNLGAIGEIVDYGCMTHTCGFAPVQSSQGGSFLREGRALFGEDSHYNGLMSRKIGESLLSQMGLPEKHIRAIAGSSSTSLEKFEELGSLLEKIVYHARPGEAGASLVDGEWQIDPKRLDFEKLPIEDLHGQLRLHEYFREAASDFYRDFPMDTRASAVEKMMSFARDPGDTKLRSFAQGFVDRLHSLLADVADVNHLGDTKQYAKNVEQLARFKNRDIFDLVRPNLFSAAGDRANQFVARADGPAVQNYIDQLVESNRFGTSPGAENGLITRAGKNSTEIYIRSFAGSGGRVQLFKYPDRDGAKIGEKFRFRVSTDAWVSYQDLDAVSVKTRVGEYLKIEIPNSPHQALTWDQVQLAPFVQQSDGQARWILAGENIHGPPLVFNERLGLPENMSRERAYLTRFYGIGTAILPDDLLSGPPTAGRGETFEQILGQFEDKNPVVRGDAILALHDRSEEFMASYAREPAIRKYFGELIASTPFSGIEIQQLDDLVGGATAPRELREAVDRSYFGVFERILALDSSETATFIGRNFAKKFAQSTSTQRKQFVQVYLRALKTGKAHPSVSYLLFRSTSFASSPEGREVLRHLVPKIPEQARLLVAAITKPEFSNTNFAADIVLKLLDSESKTYDVLPRIFTSELGWKDSPATRRILERAVEHPNLLVRRGVLLYLKINQNHPHFVQVVNRLIARGGTDDAIIAQLLQEPSVLMRPEAYGWMRTFAERGDVSFGFVEAMTKAYQLPEWKNRTELLDHWVPRLLRDRSAMGSSALFLRSNLAKESPQFGKWLDLSEKSLNQWFSESEALADKVQILSKASEPPWITRPFAAKMIHEAIDSGQMNKEIGMALSAHSWASQPEVVELWAALIKKDSSAAAAGVSRFFEIPGWAQSNDIGKLLKLFAGNEHAQGPLLSALMSHPWGSLPEAPALLKQILSSVNTKSHSYIIRAKVIPSLLHDPYWANQPAFESLVGLLRQQGWLNFETLAENGKSLSALWRLPIGTELFEEAVKAGKISDQWIWASPGIMESPLFQYACQGRPVALECLRRAFANGFTFKDSLRSRDPELRQLTAQLIHRYQASWKKSAIDANHSQALRDYHANPETKVEAEGAMNCILPELQKLMGIAL